ncbi:MAG: DNA recombination protein RmuC [Clostridia bacterium]|nr:DNA recombination protein RmuC [Clostridia bacterium]
MDNILILSAIALLFIAVILLIVLLVRQGRTLRAQEQHQHQQAQYLQNMAYELFDELDHQRDEHASALADGNSALLNTLTQLGQSQSGLLESMQRQVLLSTRNQEERAGQMAASVTASLSQLDARMESLRQANDRQLADMRRTVDEKLTESIDKRLNDSFAQVSQRLEQVYKSLGEMQSLAVGVGDLKKVLTNVKTRGIWGEMQLGSLLSAMLSPSQYDENVAVVPGSQERVEFAVRLPGKESDVLYLPIDSKFPQEDYLRLMEASQSGDAAAADIARKALIQRMKQEAKRIAGKYIAPPYTTDFAIMFLPIEGLYAEVVQTPDLCESLQREHRIVVAGPSTFSALLNALQMGFRTLAIEKRSSEVWTLLGAVKNDFDKFAETLEKTRQRLVQATESIDTAFTRTRSIQRRLGAVETPDE